MPRGTITAFDAAKGSGTVKLETGQPVHFDVSVSTSPHLGVGRSVEVVTGLSRAGQLVARIVLVDEGGDESQPFDEGFAALQRVGLLREWNEAEAKKHVGGANQLTREGAGELLLAYYGTKGLTARAKADRVAYLDEHFGDSPVIPIEGLASFAPAEAQNELVASGKAAHPFSLGTVLAAFNAVLQHKGLALHYYLLDADSDRYVVVALRDDEAARAAQATVLRIVS
jgi:cold shock CspA family protein